MLKLYAYKFLSYFSKRYENKFLNMSFALLTNSVENSLKSIGYAGMETCIQTNNPMSRHFALKFDVVLNTYPYFLKVDISYQNGSLENFKYVSCLPTTHAYMQEMDTINLVHQENVDINNALVNIRPILLQIFSIM